MKWINKLAEQLISYIPDSRIRVEAELRSDGRLTIPSEKIARDATLFRPQTYDDWINAVYAATAEEQNLALLHDLYQNLLLDAHLRAVIESRIYRTLRSKFIIRNANGEPVPKLAKLLKRPWFEQFITEAMMSKFTGIKVIELFELDKNLELEKITSIPLSHIRPDKKMIVYEPYGTNGYNYTKSPYNRYYIQIGDRYELGLLAQLAPLVLAKKLSMGSWLDFIEKFGVPSVFITTDNHTNQRAQELFEMGKKFISTSIAVLHSGETIELGPAPQTDTYKVFDEMIKRINSEISKAVLGQDATTTQKDNKGTYGSLKIMEKVADDRHESDKLFIENVINKQLFPKLTSISSAYAPLKGKIFDWDESEHIDNATYLDRVIRLKQAGFDIDATQVAERTGVPIIGMSSNNDIQPQGSKKKSPDLTAQIRALYEQVLNDPHGHTEPEPAAIDISAYTKILLRIARKVFKSAKPADWDDELISRIFDDLAGAAEKGYGEKWIKFDPYHSPTIKLLQKNLFFFSVGKSMAELQELNALLVDENGKMRDWPSFRDAVLKLNKRYNKAYLQAEWQTARASAQQARIWNEAMEVKDLYPNLEYVTARDDRVRDSHAKLDGIIRPIDDKFWDTHYPPNGWRCRCSVRSSDAEPTPENKIPHVDVHPHFRHNVGKIGQIFNQDKHPYFKYIFDCTGTEPSAGKKIKCKPAIDINSELGKKVELYKLNNPHYQKVYTGKAGGEVYISMFADTRNKKLFIQDVEALFRIVDKFKVKAYIQPLTLIKGKKTPEYIIESLIADRKRPLNDFKKALSKGRRQGCESLVIEIHEMNIPIEEAKKRILHLIKKGGYSNYKEFYLLDKTKVEYLQIKKATRK